MFQFKDAGKEGGLGALLPLLRPLCLQCTKLLAGEVALVGGILAGLAGIVRSGPVVVDWQVSLQKTNSPQSYMSPILCRKAECGWLRD